MDPPQIRFWSDRYGNKFPAEKGLTVALPKLKNYQGASTMELADAGLSLYGTLQNFGNCHWKLAYDAILLLLVMFDVVTRNYIEDTFSLYRYFELDGCQTVVIHTLLV